MIRYVVEKVLADVCFNNVDIPNKYLVEVASLFMGNCREAKSRGEP